LTTQLYKRFLVSGNVPILLKSVELFDHINGNYDNFLLGKYTGQSTLDILTYGFVQYATVSNSLLYTNPVSRKFLKIFMNYFYFNGEDWIEVTEEFGGNDDSWYNEYKDKASNNVFLQHKIEYPIILTNYLEPFAKIQDDAELVSATRHCKHCKKRSIRKKSKAENKDYCCKGCQRCGDAGISLKDCSEGHGPSNTVVRA
jgi:hypothetical protein